MILLFTAFAFSAFRPQSWPIISIHTLIGSDTVSWAGRIGIIPSGRIRPPAMIHLFFPPTGLPFGHGYLLCGPAGFLCDPIYPLFDQGYLLFCRGYFLFDPA